MDATKTSLVVKEQQVRAEISISSDFALYQALQRRTLAMDLTGLASYEVMRKWVERMFALYFQAPAPGFQRVTWAQLLRADKQAFMRLGEQFKGSLKSFAGAGKPLDPFIARMDSDMTVTYFMLPIPVSHAASGSSGDKADKDKKRPDAPAGNKGQPGANKFQKGSRKVTQKGGKSKKARSSATIAEGDALQNSSRRSNLLWYNLGSCKQGASCPRKHLCAIPGCYKSHPQTNINEVVQTLMELHKGQGNASFKLSTINKSRQVMAWNYFVVQVT